MSDGNSFQFAKSDTSQEVVLLDASMNDFAYHRHAHEEFSFGVTLHGRQDFFALGENQKSYPGNVLVFNPGDVHDGRSGGDDPLHYKMLYIHPDQLQPMLTSAGASRQQSFRINHNVLDDTTLRQHILRLSRLVEDQSTSELAYSSALFEFAHHLVSRQVGEADTRLYRFDPAMERAKEFLIAHVGEEVSLDQLSQQVNLSKYHFLRRFRDYFGMTPHQYWLNVRINRAREALALGMPVADVAFNLGFNDLSHFNRRFKPIFGMTPHQYQRLLTNA